MDSSDYERLESPLPDLFRTLSSNPVLNGSGGDAIGGYSFEALPAHDFEPPSLEPTKIPDSDCSELNSPLIPISLLRSPNNYSTKSSNSDDGIQSPLLDCDPLPIPPTFSADSQVEFPSSPPTTNPHNAPKSKTESGLQTPEYQSLNGAFTNQDGIYDPSSPKSPRRYGRTVRFVDLPGSDRALHRHSSSSPTSPTTHNASESMLETLRRKRPAIASDASSLFGGTLAGLSSSTSSPSQRPAKRSKFSFDPNDITLTSDDIPELPDLLSPHERAIMERLLRNSPSTSATDPAELLAEFSPLMGYLVKGEHADKFTAYEAMLLGLETTRGGAIALLRAYMMVLRGHDLQRTDYAHTCKFLTEFDRAYEELFGQMLRSLQDMSM